MSRRERLPDRREQITEEVVWKGVRAHVSAGLTRDGRILECFLSTAMVGSEIDHLLADFAVTLSRGLQHGDLLVDLAAGLGRLPDGAPASICGAVVDKLLDIEDER